MPEDVRLLELEERLAADLDGQERDRLLVRLRTLRAAARAELDKGLPAVEARRQRAWIDGLEAGEKIVERLWAFFNRPRA